ncbi:Zinc finger, FYVE/PHD-type [Pseudocohnilembus persalinus]|uniref:Zinc finger, FYVE/PHD-type n=1 Tax=Pseudocohnilembus persalinus TaxID=266149 RepID=A0A0V0QCD6_PSEPJ|nr:Zinc finger, FYVE/PHD-type [Pseudocohnilembus persalinus]|eukprot:KRW99767.1 Zinc finger, FYVE/PHD-type [Pseudocohnilembus persalinus]
MQESELLYQSVDDSIRILEVDLKKFEDELKSNSNAAQSQIDSITNGTYSLKKKKKYEIKFLTKMMQDKKQDKLLQSAIDKEKEIATEWEINPAEPTYCFCNKASYGEMVQCENEFCEKEWFHYDCVGLSEPPVGKWYCKECASKQQKK